MTENIREKNQTFTNPLIVTHDGEFHADEVVGVSLLKMVFKDVRIIRTRDNEKIKKADFVLDVGGIWDPATRNFDHHQKSYSGNLASAGMVLEWLEKEGYIDSKYAAYLQQIFLKGVDMQDTGNYSPKSGICTFSDVISFYNPVLPRVSEYEYLEGFVKAVDFTLGFLERIKLRYIQNRKYQTRFLELLQKRDLMPPKILVMEEPIPSWREYIFTDDRCHDLLFVVFPENESKWILHTIPQNQNNPYSNRIQLPEDWAGLLEGEFLEKTGIKDAIFCHKQRFMAAFKTKDSAIHAAKTAIHGLD